MATRTTRVMVAAGEPGVRRILETKVKEHPGYVVVGEAESGAAALSLARSLRPDVAIIDSALPAQPGPGALPLSRINGLDTAEAISEALPNVRVILLTATDAWTSPEGSGDPGAVLAGSTARSEAAASLAAAAVPDTGAGRRKPGSSSIFTGTLVVLLGLTMVVTLLMAPVGLFLVAAGLITMAFGFVSGKLRPRGHRPLKTAAPRPGRA